MRILNRQMTDLVGVQRAGAAGFRCLLGVLKGEEAGLGGVGGAAGAVGFGTLAGEAVAVLGGFGEEIE